MQMQLFFLIGAVCATISYARPAVGQFPPGFEQVLPEDAKQALRELHTNKDLTVAQRREGIEKVFDALPLETLKKLPLPPGLERLPEEHKEKFRALHINRNLTWQQRHDQVQEAIKSLPEELQRVVEAPKTVSSPQPNGLFNRPPPGFEQILSPSLYQKLIQVHQDESLNEEQRKIKIDAVMRMAPREQLERLPLPPGFERLPEDVQRVVRALFTDYSLDWATRHSKVQDFIQNLPREIRRLLRPPPPPGFEQLPEDVRFQIEDTLDEQRISFPEKMHKIRQLIQSLPADIRAKIPPPPPQPSMNSNFPMNTNFPPPPAFGVFAPQPQVHVVSGFFPPPPQGMMLRRFA